MQPTCVKSYKGGNWTCSLKTMGLGSEFWLLLRGYLYVCAFCFFFFLKAASSLGASADPTSQGIVAEQGKSCLLLLGFPQGTAEGPVRGCVSFMHSSFASPAPI